MFSVGVVPAEIPVSADPSPSKEVAVTTPVTLIPPELIVTAAPTTELVAVT